VGGGGISVLINGQSGGNIFQLPSGGGGGGVFIPHSYSATEGRVRLGHSTTYLQINMFLVMALLCVFG